MCLGFDCIDVLLAKGISLKNTTIVRQNESSLHPIQKYPNIPFPEKLFTLLIKLYRIHKDISFQLITQAFTDKFHMDAALDHVPLYNAPHVADTLWRFAVATQPGCNARSIDP